ncbi:MAG TPA: FAD-dependent oxidoreductase, partial [Myxococcota bacterium]|nr:FAD-dependent oxidoreductase [Myxococcota bacterium]
MSWMDPVARSIRGPCAGHRPLHREGRFVKDDAQSKRVVIVGGGFAGAYAAQRLARHARRLGLDVTLVNRTNYFIFYPLLVEAGTGSLEPRHAVVPLRRMIDHGRFLMADVTDIDLEAQRVHAVVRGGETHSLPYDHVIITPGSVTLMPPVPGLAEHGLQMKSMADAVGLRDRAIQLLEVADTSRDVETRRRLLRFVVVGGAYTGVEVAGELDVFLH